MSEGNRDALLQACREGDVRQVDLLLASDTAPIDCADAEGETPLMKAVRGEFASVVMALLAKGADTSMQSKAGLAAVDLASPSIAKLIVDHINTSSKGDESALVFYVKHAVVLALSSTLTHYFVMEIIDACQDLKWMYQHE